MANRPLQLASVREDLAKYVAHEWHRHNSQRHEKIAAWKEIRNYVFATDTSKTTNASLPWKNSTTLPKLCQIRDNLHSNYVSALFPNDEWMKWEAYTKDDAGKEKTEAIEAYMSNKARTGHFRTEMSQLLLDYIDYGNAFAYVDYVNVMAKGDKEPETTVYNGPRVYRISPLDIVFNPLARSFKESYKIVRAIYPIGELMRMARDNPSEYGFYNEVFKKRAANLQIGMSYGIEDNDKAEGLQVDGFGSWNEYLQSGYVEVLTFYGDLFDMKTGNFQDNRRVTIIDRLFVADNRPIDNWSGSAPIFHVGWRKRPDNLWSMGPLENLVGMQYRIDHLENAKADAMDLAIHPPLVIAGEVEEFVWGPGAEIHIDENGQVTELARNTQWVIVAETNIDKLEMRMEQYAGAPREAMGIRTAGEKTAFEVQALQNAAGRIFQEKITTFEIEMLEPVLNAMLEVSKHNMLTADWVRVIDNDLGVQSFMQITKDDITASGLLRPVGARHFAAQAQMVQNLTQLSNTPIWQQIAPHVSSKQLAKSVEDLLNFRRFQLIRPNVAVTEQQETARLANQAGEDLEMEQSIPLEE